jgi:hypothetical protein
MEKIIGEVNQRINVVFNPYDDGQGQKSLPILKVPKREIFDRSDFPDFYTIKSLPVGDFGVKIKKNLQNI